MCECSQPDPNRSGQLEHLREAHLWGIQQGLELIEREGEVFVDLGRAVDARGRTAVLSRRHQLDVQRSLLKYDTDQLEVLVAFDDRRDDGGPDSGLIVLRSKGSRAGSDKMLHLGHVQLAGPPGRPTYAIDKRARIYAGVRANRLMATGDPQPWLEVVGGAQRAAVVILGDGGRGGVRITHDDLTVPGRVDVSGDVNLGGRLIVSPSPSQPPAATPSIANVNGELRMDLGKAAFVVGETSDDGTQFDEVLRVRDGAVEVTGDLLVDGHVSSGSRPARPLTDQAKVYIEAMTTHGLKGGPIADRTTFEAIVALLMKAAADNGWTNRFRELVCGASDALEVVDLVQAVAGNMKAQGLEADFVAQVKNQFPP